MKLRCCGHFGIACDGCGASADYCACALFHVCFCCNPESAGSQAKLDRMCVHAGDGQTYLVRVDNMS